MKLTFGKFILGTGGVLCMASNSCSNEKMNQQKPNFLFIFADDQTYNSINALGNEEVHTPNLDKLVKNGVSFTQCYNQGSWSGAVSMPSRTMILTGQYVFQAARNKKILAWNGAEDKFTGNASPTNVPTWPQTLRNAGYTTFFTGKWHNAYSILPREFDYAEAIGLGMYEQFDEQGSTKSGYNRPTDINNSWTAYNKKLKGHWSPRVFDLVKNENGESVLGAHYTVEQHTSELYADKAIDFLQTRVQNLENPFMMYVAFNAPHDPRQSPKKYVDMYPPEKIKIPENFAQEHPFDQGDHNLRDERLAPFPRTKKQIQVHRSEYYAIITHLDHQIGRILKALEKSGKAENTYIIFTADHGLAVGSHGLMGKQNQYDHSVRVPFVMTGPNIKKNSKNDAMIYLQSIFSTTCDYAGIEIPKTVDYKSLKPLINGEKTKLYDEIFGAYIGFQRMVRTHRYKLIHYAHIGKTQLFDMKNDPNELHDLYHDPSMIKVKKEMINRMKKEQKIVGDPLVLNF